MAKDNVPEQKQETGTLQFPSTANSSKNETTSTTSQGTDKARKSTRTKSSKNKSRPQIGGTAVPGAKSTLPKPVSTSNNPQQQEMETANRTMRRRMEHLGTTPQAAEQTKTAVERRKERVQRLKDRQKAQVSAVKRSLPGGRLATDTSRVYYLIGGVAAAIVLVIVLFVVLRVTGVLH